MKANRLRLEQVGNGWIFVATEVSPNNPQGIVIERLVFTSLDEAVEYIQTKYKE